MISTLTETIMSLIEETDDSTHERTGQGELEAAFPPPPPHLPLPNLGQLRFFRQQQKLWQNQYLQKFSCFVSSFFSLKAIFFLF